jgi:hypothetical protein
MPDPATHVLSSNFPDDPQPTQRIEKAWSHWRKPWKPWSVHRDQTGPPRSRATFSCTHLDAEATKCKIASISQSKGTTSSASL